MPSNRGARRKHESFGSNVFRDDAGIAVICRAAGRTREIRLPADTPIRRIRATLEDGCAALRAEAARPVRAAGTVAAAAAAYLDTLPHTGTIRRDKTSHVAAWLPAIGHRPIAELSVDDVQRQIRDWIDAGVAPNTIKHRRRVLAHVLDHATPRHPITGAPTVPNVARLATTPRDVLAPPNAYPMPFLEAVVATVGPRRARAQLGMMLWTGLAPASLRRLDPWRAIRLPMQDREIAPTDEPTITLPARKKGAGAEPVTLPLFPEQWPAVRAWLRAFAWGKVDQANLYRRLASAAAAYRRTHPDAPAGPINLLTLRHSFLTWLLERTGNPYLVQLYGQHADLTTTYRYTRRAVAELARAAVRAAREATVRATVSGPHPRTPADAGGHSARRTPAKR
jgi:integrase